MIPPAQAGSSTHYAAMALQLSAQRRQTSAQRVISGSLMASHASAHWRQISAQAPQTTSTTMAQRSIASALVAQVRSEEHTSELQALMRISYAVSCLNKTSRKQKTTLA